MFPGKKILTPTTDSSATSDIFHVDGSSVVIYIAPASGEDLTDDDAFELRRVIDEDEDPIRSIKQFDKDGAIMLGANMPQYEVMIRGPYLIEKILATTETVGVYRTHGLEAGI